MPDPTRRHLALALGQLRTAATLCCWIVGLALATQAVAWSLLSFTDIRYETLEPTRAAGGPKVVDAAAAERSPLLDLAADDVEPVEVNRQLAPADGWLRVQTGLAAGAGIVAGLCLVPIVMLAIFLAVAAGTEGVERSVRAFLGSLALLLMILPLRRFMPALPFDGLFVEYDALNNMIRAHAEGTTSAASFYATHLVLPLAAILGVTLVGLWFRGGIEAGLMPRENFRLDPRLEREVSNLKAGSLIGGGRVAGALRGIDPPAPAPRPARDPEPDAARSLRTGSPGKPLPRPI